MRGNLASSAPGPAQAVVGGVTGHSRCLPSRACALTSARPCRSWKRCPHGPGPPHHRTARLQLRDWTWTSTRRLDRSYGQANCRCLFARLGPSGRGSGWMRRLNFKLLPLSSPKFCFKCHWRMSSVSCFLDSAHRPQGRAQASRAQASRPRGRACSLPCCPCRRDMERESGSSRISRWLLIGQQPAAWARLSLPFERR